jgi:hypothetical protein
MKSLLRFIIPICVAFVTNNVFAISGTFDVGGGASIPLPPGEWSILQDSRSDWGNGRRIVLGAKDVSGEIPLLSFAYTQSGQRWRSDPECFNYFGTNKVPYVSLYGSKPGALKQKCAIIWGSSDSFSETQKRLLNKGNRWWTEANPGLSKGTFTGEYSETEIHLRDFGRRNFSMNLFVRNPIQRYVNGNHRQAAERYEKWLEVYVEALQKAFQDQLPPKRIAAIDFYPSDLGAVMVKTEPEQADAKLIIQERPEQQREAQAELHLQAEAARAQLAANEKIRLEMAEQKQLAQERLAAEQKAQAEQLLAKEAELALLRAQLERVKKQVITAPEIKVADGAEQHAQESELNAQKSAPTTTARAEEQTLASRGDSNALTKITPKPQVADLQPRANRKALIFGNDAYASVPKLENAKYDALAIADGLRRVGYQVFLETDATRSKMNAAIRRFKSTIEGGDEVAIFYAGHAVQIANTNYLLPIDLKADSEDQIKDDAVPLQRLLDDVADRNAKFTLAIIDACRDNPFKSKNGRSIGGTRGLSPTTAATGQMIVFSAGSGQQALDKLGPDDESKNGLFTRTFLKHIDTPGVSVDQIVRDVREEVVKSARSVGHEQVPAIYDQVIGRFYFRN